MDNKLTHLERAEVIIKEVEELRQAQKAYFKHRNPNRLDECKDLEKRVDKMIHRYWEIKIEKQQPKLF